MGRVVRRIECDGDTLRHPWLYRQFVLGPDHFLRLRFGRQIKHEILQHEALAHRIRPKREVSPRDASNRTREFAARSVTTGLTNDVFRRKRWQAEALPQRLPKRSRIA